MKQRQLLFLLAHFISAIVYGQSKYTTAIDLARSQVIEVMDSQYLAGMAVAVSLGDRLLWSEGFGYSDLENEVSVDPALSLFRIGSISKTLTASALATLYEIGKLDLDAPVEKYYPSFPPKRGQVTVRQLGGHIAGIRHYRGNEFLSNKRYVSVEESMQIFINDPLLFMPGEKYSYSSYGWNLLSLIAEKITQVPFLTFMNQSVFTPLQMLKTQPDYPEKITPGRVRFYQMESGYLVNCPYVDNSYKWAGGGFLSTAEDLIKFGQAYLENRLVSSETFKIFSGTQFTNAGLATGYGIGWRTATDNYGHAWVGHSGGSVGGISMLQIFPAEKLVVVVLTNTSPANIGNLTSEIANAFIKIK
jgi:CubicO group peptidase (beta-lactamase class C family)